MNKWMLLLSLFSAASYSDSHFSTEGVENPDFNSSGFKPPEVSRQEQNNIVCESVVCNSISRSQPVPEVGEVPEREPNKTLEMIASAIYIAGGIGIADNLIETDDEQYVVE